MACNDTDHLALGDTTRPGLTCFSHGSLGGQEAPASFPQLSHHLLPYRLPVLESQEHQKDSGDRLRRCCLARLNAQLAWLRPESAWAESKEL